MDRFVVISGCSSGGKSALLTELARRGYPVVSEPGRRIVKQQLACDGSALPWADGVAFARCAIEMALADRGAAAQTNGWVFFDRGLVDAAAALQHLTGEPALAILGARHRYHQRVFIAPPWPEIYVTDAERRHSFDAASAEYERLTAVYPALGYQIVLLPKTGIAERADFVISTLSSTTTAGVTP